MTLLMGPTTGLERIARAITLICSSDLNDEIASVESAWSQEDQEYALLMEQTYQEIAIERIPRTNFYLGHRPSILEGDIARFPNISVFGANGRPGLDNDDDFYHGYACTVRVEIFVKAGPYDSRQRDITGFGEDLVNRRVQRTTDALIALINKNGNLGGLVSPMDTPPVVDFSDVFVKRVSAETDESQVFFFQGSQIMFSFRKLMSLS